MRRFLVAALWSTLVLGAPLSALAGSYNEAGQFVGTVNSQLAAVVANAPPGQLSAIVGAMVKQNPDLAADVVYLANNSANPQVKRGLGGALASAGRFFAACQSCRPGSSGQIASAMAFADATTLAGFEGVAGAGGGSTGGQSQSQSNVFIPGLGSRTSCAPSVSPSTISGC